MPPPTDPRCRRSWPQHSPDSDTNGYTAGCYNENLAAGDLPPVQAAITVPWVLGSPLAVAGVDSRAG